MRLLFELFLFGHEGKIARRPAALLHLPSVIARHASINRLVMQETPWIANRDAFAMTGGFASEKVNLHRPIYFRFSDEPVRPVVMDDRMANLLREEELRGEMMDMRLFSCAGVARWSPARLIVNGEAPAIGLRVVDIHLDKGPDPRGAAPAEQIHGAA